MGFPYPIFYPQRTRQSSTLYNNIAAYWKLDEVSDGGGAVSRLDSVGGVTLTDVNTVPSTTGKVGLAASFTGANSESLYCDDNATVSMGDVNYTWLLWFKTGASVSGTQMILTKYYSAEYRIYIYGGVLYADVRNIANDTAGERTAAGLQVNTWYMVEVSHDADNDQFHLSVNAGARSTLSWAGGVRDSTNRFRLGASTNASGDGTNFFTGLIDNVALWKGRILTTNEVAEYYNGGNGKAL